MSLNIGRITYLNCVPFFHYLEEMGFAGQITNGVPAELNRKLSEGTLDVCPSSSFEYALHSASYCFLPDVSISSIGPVQSVLWFAPQDASSLEGRDLFLTGESATSINLLKVILQEFCKVDGVRYQVPDAPIEELLARGESALLIGDRALRAARFVDHARHQIVDLGEVWYQYTGLPFVYALWIARLDAVREKLDDIQMLMAQLQMARLMAFDHLDELSAEFASGSGMSGADLKTYWQTVSYDLTDGHLEGLKLYFTLCHKYGLLDAVPEFHLFSSELACCTQ